MMQYIALILWCAIPYYEDRREQKFPRNSEPCRMNCDELI